MTSAYEIFTITTFPTHTYVSRRDKYESALEFTIKSRIIGFIHGPTKSGKTVLADYVAQKLDRDCCKIIARDFKSPDEFWEVVARELKIPDTIEESKSLSDGTAKTVSALAKITAWLIGEAEISGSITKSSDTERTITSTTSVDPRQKVKRLTLIIDNFHYIQDKNIQREILRELRNLLGQIAVIIIAITQEPDYLIDIEPELAGRCKPITIRDWTENELMEIVEKGFRKLNLEITGVLRRRLFVECFDSPAIMQAICLWLALILGYEQASKTRDRVTMQDAEGKLSNVFKNASELFSMHKLYDRLMELAGSGTYGSAAASIRAQPINGFQPRNIIQDTNISIHEAVLQTIFSQSDTTKSLKELEQSYKNVIISHNNVPVHFEKILSDLHRASILVWQEQIKVPSTSEDMNLQSTIEISLLKWDPKSKIIKVQDPFFGFFARWSGYLRELE